MEMCSQVDVKAFLFFGRITWVGERFPVCGVFRKKTFAYVAGALLQTIQKHPEIILSPHTSKECAAGIVTRPTKKTEVQRR
jgi:hypothetical protein